MLLLWENNVPGLNTVGQQEIPSVIPYISENRKTDAAVLVFPGGGYSNRVLHEGEPIAKWCNKLGICSFLVNYRVNPYRYPYPILDGMRALRFVRCNHKKWGINPNKVGVIGFSAGGHLSSTIGTLFDEGDNSSQDPVERTSCRPDFMILCYPVINMGLYKHMGSYESIFGKEINKEFETKFSNEKNVTVNTPTTFIWHCFDDLKVPVQNSINFAEALARNSVSFELHIFDKGGHGGGLCYEKEGSERWTLLCSDWLRRINMIL